MKTRKALVAHIESLKKQIVEADNEAEYGETSSGKTLTKNQRESSRLRVNRLSSKLRQARHDLDRGHYLI